MKQYSSTGHSPPPPKKKRMLVTMFSRVFDNMRLIPWEQIVMAGNSTSSTGRATELTVVNTMLFLH